MHRLEEQSSKQASKGHLYNRNQKYAVGAVEVDARTKPITWISNLVIVPKDRKPNAGNGKASKHVPRDPEQQYELAVRLTCDSMPMKKALKEPGMRYGATTNRQLVSNSRRRNNILQTRHHQSVSSNASGWRVERPNYDNDSQRFLPL